MFLASPFALLVLAASPNPALATETAPPAQTPAKMEDLFPTPKEGLTIVGGNLAANRGKRAERPDVDLDPQKLANLLDEFSRVTGIALQITKDTRSSLLTVPTGLNSTIVVPPSEVYRIVETLLAANDFALVHLSDTEPRIWSVQSLQGQGGRVSQLRNNAVHVQESELGAWMAHPATLITTTISLPNTDVRTLSNSLRTLFTDANTQQIIPVGSSGLFITGFASNVNSLVRMLRSVDELERELPEKRAEPSVKPAPAAK